PGVNLREGVPVRLHVGQPPGGDLAIPAPPPPAQERVHHDLPDVEFRRVLPGQRRPPRPGRGEAAARAVCTRSSALGQSPVSSQPDRSSALDRASTNSRNPSGSDGRSSTGNTSTEVNAINPPVIPRRPAGQNNPGGLTCIKRRQAGRMVYSFSRLSCPAARCCRDSAR